MVLGTCFRIFISGPSMVVFSFWSVIYAGLPKCFVEIRLCNFSVCFYWSFLVFSLVFHILSKCKPNCYSTTYIFWWTCSEIDFVGSRRFKLWITDDRTRNPTFLSFFFITKSIPEVSLLNPSLFTLDQWIWISCCVWKSSRARNIPSLA